MKHTLNIALLQLAPCGTLQENLRKGAAACRRGPAAAAQCSKCCLLYTSPSPRD